MRGGTATLLAAFALSLLSVAGIFNRIVKLACKRTARISLLSVLGFNGGIAGFSRHFGFWGGLQIGGDALG